MLSYRCDIVMYIDNEHCRVLKDRSGSISPDKIFSTDEQILKILHNKELDDFSINQIVNKVHMTDDIRQCLIDMANQRKISWSVIEKILTDEDKFKVRGTLYGSKFGL